MSSAFAINNWTEQIHLLDLWTCCWRHPCWQCLILSGRFYNCSTVTACWHRCYLNYQLLLLLLLVVVVVVVVVAAAAVEEKIVEHDNTSHPYSQSRPFLSLLSALHVKLSFCKMPSVQRRSQYTENKLLVRITDYISTTLHVCFQISKFQAPEGQHEAGPTNIRIHRTKFICPGRPAANNMCPVALVIVVFIYLLIPLSYFKLYSLQLRAIFLI
jgi:hypothetical protein